MQVGGVKSVRTRLGMLSEHTLAFDLPRLVRVVTKEGGKTMDSPLCQQGI